LIPVRWSRIPLTGSAEASAISVSASLKAIAPVDRLELFALAGPGLYFVSSRGTASTPGFGAATVSDNSNAFGFHFGGGASVRVSPQVSLGAELRYIIATVKIFGQNNGMDSLIAQGTLGLRF
jgi:opacity protein-like surface antigen